MLCSFVLEGWHNLSPLRLSRALQAAYRTYAQPTNPREDDIMAWARSQFLYSFVSRDSYRRICFRSPRMSLDEICPMIANGLWLAFLPFVSDSRPPSDALRERAEDADCDCDCVAVAIGFICNSGKSLAVRELGNRMGGEPIELVKGVCVRRVTTYVSVASWRDGARMVVVVLCRYQFVVDVGAMSASTKRR
ncbi:hypothetical protein BDV95DRAFT_289224 [Massariosphaeria phaeospora]|uniref:Uncharacterized protein n=1 Tax=Massariosphaeria phaeospora TaxID=100035 RepID=A0A7C8M055_9PLEO|nr:hypothetical protein BDV95DRAFT_289224 [Massariosphaeria phaeospora]